MNKVIRILAITFMSVLVGLFTMVLFTDIIAITKLSAPEAREIGDIFIPALIIEVLSTAAILAIGIIGIVANAKGSNENVAYNLAAGSMMIYSFFNFIENFELYFTILDLYNKAKADSYGESVGAAPQFPFFAILMTLGIFVVLTVSVFIVYKKSPITKSVLNIIGFGLLAIYFIFSASTIPSDFNNGVNIFIQILSIITFLGFLGMAVMGIVCTNMANAPAPVAAPISSQSPAPVAAPIEGNGDVISKLKSLKELHEAGILSDEEYKDKSSKYIDLL